MPEKRIQKSLPFWNMNDKTLKWYSIAQEVGTSAANCHHWFFGKHKPHAKNFMKASKMNELVAAHGLPFRKPGSGRKAKNWREKKAEVLALTN